MRYGKIICDRLHLVITTNDSEIGYSGTMFYNADGSLKTAQTVIAENSLKTIIVPDTCKQPLNFYNFVENSDHIVVLDALTAEAQIKLTEATTAKRKAYIQARLDALSQDFTQDAVGEVVPNIAERKAEFITLHNELRGLLGLPPRA